jgi:hypothetical protein
MGNQVMAGQVIRIIQGTILVLGVSIFVTMLAVLVLGPDQLLWPHSRRHTHSVPSGRSLAVFAHPVFLASFFNSPLRVPSQAPSTAYMDSPPKFRECAEA